MTLISRGDEPSAEERCLFQAARQGSTIFDIGAFLGTHTVFFSERVGPSGRVVAFEPHPDNRAAILEQVESLRLRNVELRDVGVGRVSGSVEFVYPEDLGRGTADPEVGRAIRASEPCLSRTFPVRSLDDQTSSGELPDPDLVKVDVEGLEYDVLLGMEQTVRRRKPELFLEMHGAGWDHECANYRRVVGWLLDHRYRVRHVQSGRRLRRFTRLRDCYAGEHLYCV